MNINLSRVADLLNATGVAAKVDGNSVATLYAGPTWEHPDWGVRYAISAGPGWFDSGQGWADSEDLWVGPDDDGEAQSYLVNEASEADVAERIRAAVTNQATTVAYLNAVIPQLLANPGSLTTSERCPECGEQPDARHDEDHITVALADGRRVVLVGCEGYLTIDPNLVGVDSPNWQPADSGAS